MIGRGKIYAKKPVASRLHYDFSAQRHFVERETKHFHQRSADDVAAYLDKVDVMPLIFVPGFSPTDVRASGAGNASFCPGCVSDLKKVQETLTKIV